MLHQRGLAALELTVDQHRWIIFERPGLPIGGERRYNTVSANG
jgi:hypothetical protein